MPSLTKKRGARLGRVPAGAVVASLFVLTPLSAATDFTKYHTYDELSAALKTTVSAHADLATLTAIGKTREGRSLWAVEIANPAGTPPNDRPGLLIAANFEGDHLIGSELALYIVENLLSGYASDERIRQRLDRHVIYVVPRVNPDGAEKMFAPIKTGSRLNTTPFDWDNDARLDEDPPEDLNKDGFITLMRVKDPKGPYMVSPDDARLMKRADPVRGETGAYSVYWEGIDNDGDGYYNEDGPGGVDINRNFMHQYPYYEGDAGRYMTSEAETRALLEFVLQHKNIAAILTFGESDNLITAPTRRGEPGPATGVSLIDFADRSIAGARRTGMFADTGGLGGGRGRGGGEMMFEEGALPGGGRQAQQPSSGRAQMPAQRPATTVNAGDVDYFIGISEKYRELTGLRTPGVVRTPAGAFFEYGYYQFGVPSFSTPGWGLPAAAGRPAMPGPAADGARAAAAPGASGGAAAGAMMTAGGQRGGRGAGGGTPAAQAPAAPAAAEGIDLRLVQWLDGEKIDGFVTWTPYRHPTLGEVEIGGFKPYVLANPPAARIAELGRAHLAFVTDLTSLFARVRIAKTEVINHGGGLFRIRAEIENAGFLPTAMAQGVASRSVSPTMVQLGVDPAAIVTGNEKTMFFQALAGSGNRQSYEWVIQGKPGTSVTLKAVSQKAGSDSVTLALK